MANGRIKIGPLDMALPHWGIVGFTLLALAASIGWLGFKAWERIDKRPRVTQDYLVQAAEMQKHYTRDPPPTDEFNLLDGQLNIEFYGGALGDKCVATTRGGITRFSLDPTRKLEVITAAYAQRAEILLAGFVGRIACPWEYGCPRAGACYHHGEDLYSGQFTWCYGEQRGCEVDVWRRFPDGCTHVQIWNRCASGWGGVTWRCCLH